MRAFLSVLIALLSLLGFTVRIRADSFDSNGVKIHYTVAGEGEPVVLIHGLAASGIANWELPGVSKELAKNYRVIVIDCRGHGRSDKPHEPSNYGLELVEDVVRLLDHVKIPKAHVVGYSMGGMIAHKLAVRHPDRLNSVTLGGIGWVRENDRLLKGLNETLAKSLEDGKGLTPLFSVLAAPGQPAQSDDDVQKINKAIMALNDPKALAALIRGNHELSVSEEELVANMVPTLLLIGTLDPLKAGVDRMKEKRPSVEVIEIKDGTHMTAFIDPTFKKSLLEFLSKHKQAK